jgi:hypothetical protein
MCAADTVTDMISLYRKVAPKGPILFNYSPDSALWAISRKFPLAENCTNSPGKDLVSSSRCAVDDDADSVQGFEIICDIC